MIRIAVECRREDRVEGVSLYAGDTDEANNKGVNWASITSIHFTVCVAIYIRSCN